MEQKNVNQSKTKLNESNPAEIDPIEPKIKMHPPVEDGDGFDSIKNKVE